MYITVKDAQEAWDEVNRIFPYDYEKNENASANAGYSIYYSTSSEHPNNWVSDLGTRLEINTEDGKSVNIWIEADELQSDHDNHSSYLVYITGSSEAAHLISRGLRESTPWSKCGGKTISTSSGCVHQDCRIPSLYHGNDKFYAMMEYRNGEDWKHPEYKVVIC